MALTWMPEGTVVKPGDNEQRTAAKICQALYDSLGPKPSPFPEGLAPVPGDDLQRLYEKINYLRNT